MLPPVIAADGSTFADRQQANFRLMQVKEAWKITRGGPGCTVGVIDSGFDFFHPLWKATSSRTGSRQGTTTPTSLKWTRTARLWRA
jgi:hypothetical protein